MAKKILVIEDDRDVAKSLQAALVRFNYQVSMAANGEEGLKKIMADTPDLIILDILMPKVDGYDFLVTLKETKGRGGNVPSIPIIVTTAIADDSIREMISKEEICAYFTKPFDLKELLDKISEIIGKNE
ncbi:MAG: response regulator transcription factor [Candidatus Omnitrophota bacterium]